MTKDLALLVGPDQKWLSTTGFLDKVSGESHQGNGGVRGGNALLTSPRLRGEVKPLHRFA